MWSQQKAVHLPLKKYKQDFMFAAKTLQTNWSVNGVSLPNSVKMTRIFTDFDMKSRIYADLLTMKSVSTKKMHKTE